MALRRCCRSGITRSLGANLLSRAPPGELRHALHQIPASPPPPAPPPFFSTLANPGKKILHSELQPKFPFPGTWKPQAFVEKSFRRGVASEALSKNQSLAEKWRQSTERMKQQVLEKPRSIVESVKQSELADGTRGAISTLSAPLKRTMISYREALKLQLEAFWRRNYLIVVGAVGLAACLLLWKIMFGIASLFISLSEGLAKYGFLALAAALVSFSGMMLKARYTVNPDAVYRIAMRKLNTSAEVLKALGAPLTGTDIRAYVMTGGGLRINNLKPRLSGKRCFLIFPIQGSEKRGLVSIETKKKHGQYDFKLLAVDVAGSDGRIYVVGDDVEYKIGGGLIAELRDPIVKAMAAQNEFEAQDDREDREAAEEEARSKQAPAAAA